MQNFVGALEYLCSWTWVDPGMVRAGVDTVFHVSSLPVRIADDGELLEVAPHRYRQRVFASDVDAYDFLMSLAQADLQYRGFRDDRVTCFQSKQYANFLLYRRVVASLDLHGYEMLRQSWDLVNRPQYSEKRWSREQDEALERVSAALSCDDEAVRMAAAAWLFVWGSRNLLGTSSFQKRPRQGKSKAWYMGPRSVQFLVPDLVPEPMPNLVPIGYQVW